MLKTYQGSCHCEVRSIGVGRGTPMGNMLGINPTGLHDNWQSAPAVFSHL